MKTKTIIVLPRNPKQILVTLHTLRLKGRNDSMFYYGKHIATVEKGKRKLIIESAGEMRTAFEIDGESYQGEDLVKEFNKRGTTDRKLSIMGRNDLIQMNNWFRIVEEGKDLDHPVMEEICHTFDDAIRLAKSLLK